MTQKKTHTLSLLAALTSAVIFGMSFMFSKLALEVAAPTVLLAFRFTVAVAAMSLVILVNALVGKLRGRPLFAFSLRGKPVYKLVLLGIVQPVAYFIFENYGILYTSSAVAGTIIAAVPVCCILMDVLVLHERVTLKQVLCALGAIGGMAYIVPPVQTWNFEVGVAGAGFLAMAVMIFGQWKPFNICAAAMFFAVFKSLANIADSTFLAQFHWSSNIYNMMPFVASMVILAFTSKNSMAPKAEGIPYDKGSR